jgi:hypothetical protein
MSRRAWLWVRGLLAALIGGASTGITGALSTNVVLPETAPEALVKIAVAQMVVGAVLGCASYLKQSPLPARPSQKGVTDGVSQ